MIKNLKSKEILLSVVVLNFNGLRFLRACLDSLYEFIDVPFEIIFVDNQSSDNSVDFVGGNYRDVKIVLNPENEGFAKGNNLGVSRASGKYLLILNNDTILRSTVSAGIDILVQNPSVGVVGAKMTDISGAYRSSACRFPGILGAVWFSHNFVSQSYFNGNEVHLDYPESYTVDWVEASFSIVRRADFESIGGYNVNYFMYGEDVDFCYQLSRQGLKTVYVPQLEYVHFGGFNKDRYDLLVQGYMNFYLSNYSTVYGRLCILSLVLGLIAKIIGFGLFDFFVNKKSTKNRAAGYLKAFKKIRMVL